MAGMVGAAAADLHPRHQPARALAGLQRPRASAMMAVAGLRVIPRLTAGAAGAAARGAQALRLRQLRPRVTAAKGFRWRCWGGPGPSLAVRLGSLAQVAAARPATAPPLPAGVLAAPVSAGMADTAREVTDAARMRCQTLDRAAVGARPARSAAAAAQVSSSCAGRRRVLDPCTSYASRAIA